MNKSRRKAPWRSEYCVAVFRLLLEPQIDIVIIERKLKNLTWTERSKKQTDLGFIAHQIECPNYTSYPTDFHAVKGDRYMFF